MKKIYILEDLDCAHCAAKIEEEASKIEGVTKATCTFLTQKLTIEAQDSVTDLTQKVKKIVKKHEPDVTVMEQK